MVKERGQKLIAQNKKARYNYHIEDTFEAGLVLTGTEVKSLRAGRASLVDGYAEITGGEVWLHDAHIPEYSRAPGTTTRPAASASCCSTGTRSTRWSAGSTSAA